MPFNHFRQRRWNEWTANNIIQLHVSLFYTSYCIVCCTVYIVIMSSESASPSSSSSSPSSPSKSSKKQRLEQYKFPLDQSPVALFNAAQPAVYNPTYPVPLPKFQELVLGYCLVVVYLCMCYNDPLPFS